VRRFIQHITKDFPFDVSGSNPARANKIIRQRLESAASTVSKVFELKHALEIPVFRIDSSPISAIDSARVQSGNDEPSTNTPVLSKRNALSVLSIVCADRVKSLALLFWRDFDDLFGIRIDEIGVQPISAESCFALFLLTLGGLEIHQRPYTDIP
jgi:hypothetical protein